MLAAQLIMKLGHKDKFRFAVEVSELSKSGDELTNRLYRQKLD